MTIDPRLSRVAAIAAGVGAATRGDALPGNLARELGSRWGRGVRWRSIGETGATARDLVGRHLDDAASETWDVAFLSIGPNDAQTLRSRAAVS